jgi:putative SOS response-associated peptidase YedK
MCGRFSLVTDPNRLMLRFELENIPFDWQIRYNIAPGQLISAIIEDRGKRRIGQLKWGLVPSFSTDEKVGYKMINARSETVQTKPSFRSLLARKRAIVPANSFFEWRTDAAGKTPMRIMMKNERIFSLAALWDTWVDPEGKKLNTCVIITTKPNELVSTIHNRMPAILQPEFERDWLNRDITDLKYINSLLVSFDTSEMKAYPVSTLVGNVKNDIPECIRPISIL